MTIIDKMYEKYGKTCRWIACDDWFHMTRCLLKSESVDILYDRFEKLGFKHPEFAYEYGDSFCDVDNCSFFEKDDGRSDNVVKEKIIDEDGTEDEIEVTETELAARNVARNEFSDDENVRMLYGELKRRFLKRREEDIEKKRAEIEKLSNEEDYGNSSAKLSASSPSVSSIDGVDVETDENGHMHFSLNGDNDANVMKNGEIDEGGSWYNKVLKWLMKHEVKPYVKVRELADPFNERINNSEDLDAGCDGKKAIEGGIGLKF